jgi:hypothetical protein
MFGECTERTRNGVWGVVVRNARDAKNEGLLTDDDGCVVSGGVVEV